MLHIAVAYVKMKHYVNSH